MFRITCLSEPPSIIGGVSYRHSWQQNQADPDANAPGPFGLLGVLKCTIPSYTTHDASIGVTKDNWAAQATDRNLSSSASATNMSYGRFIKATIPLRPRVLMAELSYRF
jgi:outer membrane receptor protein involved in Fe transport